MVLTDEQIMISDMARIFAINELHPHSAEWGKTGVMDREKLVALGELGFGGIYAEEKHGGSGLGRVDAVLIFEQPSRGDISHAAFLSIHNMATWMIDYFGDDSLREKYVPRLTATDIIASYCLTEPGAGSDAASLKTTATRDGETYILNGSKLFISGAGFSDIYVVMARTGGNGTHGISTFVVEKDAPGLSFGKCEDKMGWRAQPTATVNFDACPVPASNRVGNEGNGWRLEQGFIKTGIAITIPSWDAIFKLIRWVYLLVKVFMAMSIKILF